MDLKSCFHLLAFMFGIFFYCPRTRAALSSEEEIRVNSVEISFYQLTDSDWTAKQDTFKQTIADNLNTYCENNATACGLTQWLTIYAFTPVYVNVSSTKQVQYEFNITFAVVFKENVPAIHKELTTHAVTRGALMESLRESRLALNEAMGSPLWTVDQQRYGPQPDKLINIIMSVAGAAFLVFLIILTISLYYWRKREDRKQRQLQREKNSPRTSTALPPNRVAPDQGTPNVEKGHQGHGRFHSGNRDEDSNHGNQTEDTIVNMGEDQSQNHDAPQVDDSPSLRHKSHKKHKKHRRHSKHRHSDKRDHPSIIDSPANRYDVPFVEHDQRTSGPPPLGMNIPVMSATARGSDSDNVDSGVNPSGQTTTF